MFHIPKVFNFRIICNYDVANILYVYDTANMISLPNKPMILTIELDDPYNNRLNNILNDTEIDIVE